MASSVEKAIGKKRIESQINKNDPKAEDKIEEEDYAKKYLHILKESMTDDEIKDMSKLFCEISQDLLLDFIKCVNENAVTHSKRENEALKAFFKDILIQYLDLNITLKEIEE